MTNVRLIPARYNKQQAPSQRTIDPTDPDWLIPIELSQAVTDKGECVQQDLRANEARGANDTPKAHVPPKQPCGQVQAQENCDQDRNSIAIPYRTCTPSQREIFSKDGNIPTCRTTTPSQREIFSFPYRTATPSQREIFSQNSSDDDTSSSTQYSSSLTGTDTARSQSTVPLSTTHLG